MLSSGAKKGSVGVELWISLCIAYGKRPDGTLLYFKPGDAQMLSAAPRIMVVALRAYGICVNLIVGHAPHTARTHKGKQDFWDQVEANVREDVDTYLLVDANARASVIRGDVPRHTVTLPSPYRRPSLMHLDATGWHIHLP